MTVRSLTRPAGGPPPVVDVRNPAGSVTVTAAEGAAELSVEVEALDEAAEHLLDRVGIDVAEGPPLRLRVAVPERRLFGAPAFAVRVGTPAGATVRVRAGSADCDLRGPLGPVVVASASGECAVEECTELQVRNASGDVRVGTVHGAATLGTASGGVRVGSAGGAVEVRTASGDVDLGSAGGDTSVRSASGDVSVAGTAGGDVRLTTVSGDATVGVLPGRRVWLDLSSVSGRLASDLDDDGAGDGPAELTVAVRTVSGDVRVRRTAPAA
ncbi:DUF4097 family beta strand repeat-containing protein [Geodermatophilus sp. SYSU D00708]